MKEDKVKVLLSRYDNVDTKYVLDRGKHHAFITTNSSYIRTGVNTESVGNYNFIDFEGGPMISVGDKFAGKTIKAIEYGYVITLE